MNGKIDDHQLVCGLEIHAELKTASKMFCGCKNDPFHAPKPNIYTCPVCLGMPGGLPVANKTAIEWTIMLGLSLNCKINLFSKFDRKNYFYPDLPKGYQISQYDIPFCYDGYVETSEGRVGITRIHLEEDTGKLQHKTLNDQKVSLVDFNRSGVPLIEIVSEPDIKSPTQAKEYGKKIRQQLRYLGIADCDMEQGGMRLEANISLQKIGTSKLPDYKVEVKNINSFRFMEQAIEYEMKRHLALLEEGQTPTQETRGWNPTKNQTFPQRTKEDAEDYRYFPDPDLPPLRFTKAEIEALKKRLPRSLADLEKAWQSEYGISKNDLTVLLNNYDDPLLLQEIFTIAAKEKLPVAKLASALVNKKTPLHETAQATVTAYQAATQTVDIDPDQLRSAIKTVIAQHPAELARYRAGETKLHNFFVGQVMRSMKQKLAMAEVNQLLSELLAE